MSAAFVASTPGLAPLCRTLTASGDEDGLAALDGPAVDRALALFAGRFWQPDARAVASLWSMYYLNALVVPTVAALLIHDRVLPVALADVRLRLDAEGAPGEIRLRDEGRAAGEADRGRRFDTLVHGHLVPLVALFAPRSGLSPRLLWSNAATILDYVVEAVAGTAIPAVRREAASQLDGRGAFRNLAPPVQDAAAGSRARKLCCGRRRLSGVAPCFTLCPERRVY